VTEIETKIRNKNGNYIKYSISALLLYLAAAKLFELMKSVILNAFYDAMQYNLGYVITYILVFLMLIELIYVMAKYLGPRK